MGIANKFFHQDDTVSKTLHRKISISPEELDFQQKEWNEVAEFLKEKLSTATGHSVDTRLQGSYQFKTQIRPKYKEQFDVDLGVNFIGKGNPPSDLRADKLKEEVNKALLAYSQKCPEESKVELPKERCNRISYAERHFHIDTPVYYLDSAKDKRHLATKTKGWEASDPKALYIWFKNSFDELHRPRVRRQIKYFKIWTNELPEESRLSSIALTVLVAEAYKGLPTHELTYDDDIFSALVEKLHARLTSNLKIANPADETGEDLNRLSDTQCGTFMDALKRLDNICKRAILAEDEILACITWGEAFGHFFPMPDGMDARVEDDNKSGLPVAVTIPEISVRAIPKKNQNIQHTGKNKVGPIPKECEITFQVDNLAAYKPGTTFQWIVRNDGNEAYNINDLGHTNESEDGYAEERSAYNGTHYMDCIAKWQGAIVGWQRVPVTINENLQVPLRNPPKKRYGPK